ncbi:Sporulation protein YtfJ (Spore_YtfJ) [Nonomuraea maritima]|uniref:Sporulation protein YtfJ (Spore_YtfJ) n=1 Tax=Nonomuraea maritima TaxID=683260 RepID=A0A1G8WYK8_9ACTN|nr:spore germination protein GerW family protein [Nonomuraea maritima]SDJ83301.1 Sporulation protein YtfJ (Spore_YtfJ) [Nonomuraea maritima]
MNLMELVEKSKDIATVKRVFGEPVRHGDVVVIPVARIAQGGGGGQGQGRGDKGDEGSGSGGGYGFAATPAGVFVLKDGDAIWRPAVDVNRIVVGGQIVAVVLLLTLRAILKKRRRTR